MIFLISQEINETIILKRRTQITLISRLWKSKKALIGHDFASIFRIIYKLESILLSDILR